MKQCDASNLWIRLTSTWICVFYVPSVCVRVCVHLLYICTSKWGRKVCTVLEIGRCWRGHAFHSWQVLMLQIYSLQDLLPITTRNNVSPLDWCKKHQRASRRNAIATALQKSLMWWLWNEVSHDYVNAIVSHFCSFSVFFLILVWLILISVSVPTLLTQNQSFVLLPIITAVALCNCSPNTGYAAVYEMSDVFLCLFCFEIVLI